MIVKKELFTEERPDGTVVSGVLLNGGTEVLSFYGGMVQMEVCKQCFVLLPKNHVLAQLPDGAEVQGEIVMMDEHCKFRFNDNQEPVSVYLTYGYRKTITDPIQYKTGGQQLVSEIQ